MSAVVITPDGVRVTITPKYDSYLEITTEPGSVVMRGESLEEQNERHDAFCDARSSFYEHCRQISNAESNILVACDEQDVLPPNPIQQLIMEVADEVKQAGIRFKASQSPPVVVEHQRPLIRDPMGDRTPSIIRDL